MMTSSNGNIFRVTGPLCGEFTGPGEFPAQRPVTRSFDVFFDLSLKKRLSKQPWGWWFETPVLSLWRHRNVYIDGQPESSVQTSGLLAPWISIICMMQLGIHPKRLDVLQSCTKPLIWITAPNEISNDLMAIRCLWQSCRIFYLADVIILRKYQSGKSSRLGTFPRRTL